ncbi:DUF1768-domain-containing protein [Punctularia strigosozonata HHB-11173 SS5]|uniref:DUF1768-domain-containing protein n=1 Tax=Punctularia strigosozonata (strain HHB-11173) TaxID=741275 RepID=R7S5Z2_PUNST|nr:DUF1768-domain-containing protein [Punctularia strigosozonata HHB-11173 SS5]EIN05311.1 DUF1768-domain-containing protein [Punctularia strigosozonata HHB-11173 SS5]
MHSKRWHKGYAMPPSTTQARRDEPLYFYGDSRHPHYEFSNFSPHDVEYHGQIYPTAAHLFEAYKFFTTAPEISERIRQLPKPRDALAEALKSELKDLVRADWHDVRVRVMERVLEMKFTQHQELRQILLSTGGRELVNDSTDDVFWGAGQDGKGHNELGKVLMRLRAKLQYGD